jgi:hypothetical protein
MKLAEDNLDEKLQSDRDWARSRCFKSFLQRVNTYLDVSGRIDLKVVFSRAAFSLPKMD